MAVARYLQAASEGQQQDICRCGHTHVMNIMMTLLVRPALFFQPFFRGKMRLPLLALPVLRFPVVKCLPG